MQIGGKPWKIFARELRHPEYERVLKIDDLVALYAWHGPHHVAHITSLRERPSA